MKTYVFGDPKAPVCLIQPVDDHDLEGIRNEYEKIRELIGMDFCLKAVKVNNWNKDLSPWEAPAVFGIENFGEGAADTLKEILSLCTDKDKKYYIGGYSLAGLFSLWASVQTDWFEGVAPASPSVWFPDFLDYIRERKPLCRKIYLSLGDKEEKTRNPVMATVGDKIRELDSFLAQEGFDCVLEWNEGNHFKDFDIRTAKAFASVMNRQ